MGRKHYLVSMSGDFQDDYGCADPEWLKIEWTSYLRRVELEGATVNYVDIGEGPAILFVHGLGGCWENWLENIPHFSRSHRVVALDLPGFGASPMPKWEISMPAYGRMLAEFCEKLGLDQETTVVGNSMGGFIATELVIEHPDRFSRLVLVSAAGITFARMRHEPAAVLSGLTQLARPAMVGLGRQAVSRPRLRQISLQGVVHRPARLRPEILLELARGGLAPDGFGDAVVSMAGYDAREPLAKIEIPTLIVWGYNDRIVPVRAAFSYRRRIPNSRLEIFDRTGHVPMLERPSRFNRVVEQFLRDTA